MVGPPPQPCQCEAFLNSLLAAGLQEPQAWLGRSPLDALLLSAPSMCSAATAQPCTSQRMCAMRTRCLRTTGSRQAAGGSRTFVRFFIRVRTLRALSLLPAPSDSMSTPTAAADWRDPSALGTGNARHLLRVRRRFRRLYRYVGVEMRATVTLRQLVNARGRILRALRLMQYRLSMRTIWP